MITDWIMIFITAIYVIATIIICVSNYKSAKLSKKGNEIELICKVAEIEQKRLDELKLSIDNFAESADLYDQVLNHTECESRLFSIEKSYEMLIRCLSIDNKHDSYEYQRIFQCANCFYHTSKEICKWFNEEYDGTEQIEDVKARFKKVIDVRNHFFQAKEKYILSREKLITNILLGKYSLNDLTNIYNDSNIK